MTFTRIDVLRWSDSFSEGVHTKETAPQGPLWAEHVTDTRPLAQILLLATVWRKLRLLSPRSRRDPRLG